MRLLLVDELCVLDEKHRQFVTGRELCTPQDHVDAYSRIGNLRRDASR